MVATKIYAELVPRKKVTISICELEYEDSDDLLLSVHSDASMQGEPYCQLTIPRQDLFRALMPFQDSCIK